MNQHEETTMHEEGRTPASFHHPKNISVGRGRILWAASATCISGIHHPEGWVLPGGARTNSSEVAHQVTLEIDLMSRGSA